MSSGSEYPYKPGSVDNETSLAAAESMEEHQGRLERMVFDHIKQRGEQGSTDWELEQALSMRHQTASARRRGLELKHFVEWNGEKRITDSGRQAKVWVALAREPPIDA